MAGPKALADHALVRVNYIQTTAAGAAASSHVFVSDAYYELLEVRAVCDVVGGASAAADVTKSANAAAQSGTTMLASTFDLTANARTGMRRAGATLTATQANRRLAPGDKVAVVTSGTLTGLVGLCVNIVLKPIRQNRQR